MDFWYSSGGRFSGQQFGVNSFWVPFNSMLDEFLHAISHMSIGITLAFFHSSLSSHCLACYSFWDCRVLFNSIWKSVVYSYHATNSPIQNNSQHDDSAASFQFQCIIWWCLACWGLLKVSELLFLCHEESPRSYHGSIQSCANYSLRWPIKVNWTQEGGLVLDGHPCHWTFPFPGSIWNPTQTTWSAIRKERQEGHRNRFHIKPCDFSHTCTKVFQTVSVLFLITWTLYWLTFQTFRTGDLKLLSTLGISA